MYGNYVARDQGKQTSTNVTMDPERVCATVLSCNSWPDEMGDGANTGNKVIRLLLINQELGLNLNSETVD